jgi:hypothetical protein
MSVKKELLDPDRVRSIPREGFSWLDRRFVRAGFMEQLPPEAILLYLFLVAVSDARGLSFYADPTVSRIIKLNPEQLTQARARLVSARLILYRYPLYQVLPLPQRPGAGGRSSPVSPDTPKARGGDPLPISEICRLVSQNLAARHPHRSTEAT